MARRLRRGWWAAAPRGAVLSFEAKESTKESTRHGDSRGGPRRYAPWASVCGSPSGCPRPRLAALTRREKALYCPFLKEGVRNVACSIVGQLSLTIVRARAHSFPLSKRARLFPFAAYRRSAPPQVAVSKLKRMSVGMLRRALNISQTKRPAQVQIRAGLSASHEACRRMAAFSIQLTESHTEPASHGACCATAVKPRPSRMSFYPLRVKDAQRRVQGIALPRGCVRRLEEECGCR